MTNNKNNKDKAVNRKRFSGVVVSDKMQKTVVVEVSGFHKHQKYCKFVRSSKKFKAHDEEGKYKVGDKVTIEESHPYSKDKSFVVVA